MKEILKNNYFKIIGLIILLLLILWQFYAIYIDMYNFRQLEKAKTVLESINKDDNYFYSLKEFNSIYINNIEPIKDCYYVSNDNGNEDYIFGFKLESLIYIYIYKTRYFIYPSYNLEVKPLCISGRGCIDNINYEKFIKIITNPCKD